MDKKDISQIKKVFKVDAGVINKALICYVGIEDGPKGASDVGFLTLEDEVAIKYLDIAKKGMSGKLGKNLVNLDDNGVGGAAGGAFLKLLESRSLGDMDAVCAAIAENYKSQTDYCVLAVFGNYDVPAGSKKEDECLDSEEVYSFMQLLILPVNMSKPGLAYDLGEMGVRNKELFHEIGAPDFAFLYPAFSGRHTDVDHMLYYAKKPAVVPEDLLKAFHVAIPVSPEGQLGAFQCVVQAGVGDRVPFDVARGIYGALAEMEEEKEDKNSETSMTASDILKIAASEAEHAGIAFDEPSAKEAVKASGGKITMANILPGKITIKMDEAVLKVDNRDIARIERRQIDGVDYYLVPAAGSTVEGFETANRNEIKKVA